MVSAVDEPEYRIHPGFLCCRFKLKAMIDANSVICAAVHYEDWTLACATNRVQRIIADDIFRVSQEAVRRLQLAQ